MPLLGFTAITDYSDPRTASDTYCEMGNPAMKHPLGEWESPQLLLTITFKRFEYSDNSHCLVLSTLQDGLAGTILTKTAPQIMTRALKL